MKYIFYMSAALIYVFGNVNYAVAQNSENQKISEQYKAAGQADAVALNQKFQEAEKPKYQQAYDDLWKDLEVIRKTGRAPDNEELYSDLREMNSEEGFIFSETRRGIKNYNRKAF